MSSSDHTFTTTAVGWAVIIGVIGAVVLLRSPKTRATTAKTVAQAKQDVGADIASATAALKKKAEKATKQKPKPKPKPSTSENAAAATTTTSNYDPAAEAAAKRDEARANQDFAQSLAKIKTGAQFTAPKSEKKKQKSVKQSHAQEADTPVAQQSAPSSAAGDADDDLSSAASPQAAPADTTGVSDMLESPSAGPSVLRLTDTDKVKAKPKKEKAPAVVETKKQRQNRLKNEQKKLEREQDEIERKKLEEAQRRRAREARGQAAKDGSTFTNNSNAWTAKTNGDSTPKTVQPLDTFDDLVPAANTPKPSTPQPAATKQPSDSWASSLPSEEEQIAQVMDDSSAWSEVTNKKTKKGKRSDEAVAEKPLSALTPAPVSQAPVHVNKSKPALSSHSSFAALTPEETADDEVEEEWEV